MIGLDNFNLIYSDLLIDYLSNLINMGKLTVELQKNIEMNPLLLTIDYF